MTFHLCDKAVSRPARVAAASALLLSSLCTAMAWACDPNNAKHVPCPVSAQTHQPLVYTAARKPGIGPVAPQPLRATPGAAANSKQSIIFVGGKGALNPQPIPPGHGNGKAALNPQPIPPGKVLQGSPPKWDLTKNKSS